MGFIKKLFSSKEEKIPTTEVVLEDRSPSCPIIATVEQDDRVAYFYLCGPESSHFGMKSCWVRNLKSAPISLERKLMEKGIPPMLPKEFCKFPEGQERLNAEDLKIIWTEEGDSAALVVKDEVISIIPTWSGQNGFYGYAKHCRGVNDLVWELEDSNVFIERIEKSKRYWELWNSEISPFNIQQPKILEAYDLTFGNHDKYYAIDGSKWPPKGLCLKKSSSKIIFATVGLSLLPMPTVELYSEDRFEFNRIELGLILKSDFSEKEIQQIAEWISGQSSIPWDKITFLGEGHTLNFRPFNSTRFRSVVLTNRLDVLPKPQLNDYRESKISFLWMIPISDRERDEIIENGSGDIVEKLNKIGDAVFSLQREEVV